MARVRIHPPLHIDEITIREYTLRDLEQLDAAIVRNREYLLPWIGPWILEEPIGLERRRAKLQEWVDTYATGGDNAVGIFIGTELVGGTGLHDRNGPADVEIGYWVDEARQGRGIATRASRALVEHAFAHPEVDRIIIGHHRDNARSRRVPEKLGFRMQPEPVGSACDVVWVLERASWAGGAANGPLP